LGSLDIFQNKIFKTLKQAGQRGSKKECETISKKKKKRILVLATARATHA
jgi:hypothetical protein